MSISFISIILISLFDKESNTFKNIEKLSNTEFNVLKREEKLSGDETSIRDVMQNVVEKYHLDKNCTIVMLYLTSPNRKYEDIQKIIDNLQHDELESGMVYHIKPGIIHRVEALTDLTLIESSTIELDASFSPK